MARLLRISLTTTQQTVKAGQQLRVSLALKTMAPPPAATGSIPVPGPKAGPQIADEELKIRQGWDLPNWAWSWRNRRVCTTALHAIRRQAWDSTRSKSGGAKTAEVGR